VCEPGEVYVTVQVAVLPESAIPDEPEQSLIGTPESKNSMLPVGFPAPGDVTETIAVYVTVCPTTVGVPEVLTVVIVLACPTT